MSELKEYFKDSTLFGVLIAIYLFVGGFYSGPDMILGIVSGICLIVYCWSYKEWRKLEIRKICKDPVMIAGLITFLMYVISIIWAIDRGMAVFGMVKISSLLPLIIFSLFVMPEKKHLVLVPYVGALGVIISVISLLTPWKDYFFLANRMAGPMGYPNAYGLFLLIGIMQLLLYSRRELLNIITLVMLVVGIFWTGSRITLLLLIGFLLIYLINHMLKRRSIKLVVWGIGAIGTILVMGYLFAPTRGVLERIFDISLRSSTLLGRFLYMQDAIKLLVKFPFGMGYRGYSYTQGLTASGLYSVQFVHNGFLQLALDIGVIPTLVILGMIGYAVVKNVRGKKILMCLIIGIHVFLDIDTEFMGILLCIFWLLQGESKEVERMPLKIGNNFVGEECTDRGYIVKKVILVGMMLFLLLGIVPGISDLFYLAQDYEKADEIYSHNSDARKELIYATENPYEIELIIRNLYADNPYCAVACQWMGVFSYLENDCDEMMYYFDKELELVPYSAEEYEMYLAILQDMAVENPSLRDRLIDKMDVVKNRYGEKLASMSSLGKAIEDQPQSGLGGRT